MNSDIDYIIKKPSQTNDQRRPRNNQTIDALSPVLGKVSY